MSLRVFISSVQTEFKAERIALRDYLQGDALQSVPANPVLARPLYQSGYIEMMGTGDQGHRGKVSGIAFEGTAI
ncbi:MAG: hypothetical protein IPP40_06405 [bacterium]|nr:hypothetical protein [bacterium]